MATQTSNSVTEVRARPRQRLSALRRSFGLCLLAVAVGASLVLVLEHFGAAELPGCGQASDCAAAAASRWGRIAARPLSFFGLAYFSALAVAWAMARRDGLSTGFRWLARLGVAVSVLYLAVIVADRLYCAYCLAAHAANVAFWILAELTPAARTADGRPVFAFGGVFALMLAGLNLADAERQWSRDRAAEAQTEDSIRRIRAAARDDATGGGERAQRRPSEIAATPAGSSPYPPRHATEHDRATGSERRAVDALDGRYPLGPQEARVRLVLFYDYQCQHCRDLDRELKTLLKQFRTVLSVSIRHYPLSMECNFLLTANTHPNACRAARAAEAAGMLQGVDGFWRFHDWLVRRQGAFTDEQLRAGLVELGYQSPDQFVESMNGDVSRRHVLGDIVEAEARNVERTPAVFVNGVRLESWQTDNGLARAIAAAAEEPSRAAGRAAAPSTTEPPFPDRARQRGLDATVRIVNLTTAGQGSGVVVGSDGVFFYILTVKHLARAGERLEVHTFAGEGGTPPPRVHREAEVIAEARGGDDLALVRARPAGATPSALEICRADLVPEHAGFTALSVGCSQGGVPTALFAPAVTKKHVRRSVQDQVALVWETTEDPQTGRSGGPLIDERGHVIGIQSGSNEGRVYYCHTTAIHDLLAEAGLQWLSGPETETATLE